MLKISLAGLIYMLIESLVKADSVLGLTRLAPPLNRLSSLELWRLYASVCWPLSLTCHGTQTIQESGKTKRL
jgi:hypothetical protein